jgi:hypothetical protein
MTDVRVTYLLSDEGGGTRFRRELSYRGRGRLANWADQLYFRRHNDRESRVALERLRRELEA